MVLKEWDDLEEYEVTRHTLRMRTEHLKPTSEMISRCKNAIASLTV